MISKFIKMSFEKEINFEKLNFIFAKNNLNLNLNLKVNNNI